MRYTIELICEITGGRAEGLATGSCFDGYSIDSRTVRGGELFFAVSGENHDGHEFVAGALKAGAGAAVVKEDFRLPGECEGGLIRCKDPLAAMQLLASHSRGETGLRLIGITGSCGKTTTKDITAALLSEKLRCDKNYGNLNNLYGLPLALLRRREGLDVYVCELGMSVPGEMGQLARMARPDIGVFTNIHGVHLMNFKSVREIAEAKEKMLEGMVPGAPIVANADDPEVIRIAGESGRPVTTFGLKNDADFMARDIVDQGIKGVSFTLVFPGGHLLIECPLPGTHNLQNFLTAFATCSVLGYSPDEVAGGIGKIRISPLRSSIVRFREGWTLYNDAYNSNPVALRQTLDALRLSNGFSRKVAILGDMLELGKGELDAHVRSGPWLVDAGIDYLVAVGKLAGVMADSAVKAGLKAGNVVRVPDAGSALTPAIEAIEKSPEGTLVLVKGSRGIKLEGVINGLIGRFQPVEDPGKAGNSR